MAEIVVIVDDEPVRNSVGREEPVSGAVEWELLRTLDALRSQLVIQAERQPTYELVVRKDPGDESKTKELVRRACQDGAKVFIGIGKTAKAIREALPDCNGRAKLVIEVPIEKSDRPFLSTDAVEKGGLRFAALISWQALATGDHDLELAFIAWCDQNLPH